MTIKRPTKTLWHHVRALTITAAMLVVATAAHANTANANTSEVSTQNESIVRQAFEDWAGRGGPFTRVLSPEIEWTVRGSGPFARTYNGIESFVKDASGPILSRLSTPLTPEVHDIWAVDDKVIVRFDASGTTTAGSTYSNQYLWILTMKDGLVTKSEAFLDMVAYQDLVDNNTPRAN